jgi:hypothetical protein
MPSSITCPSCGFENATTSLYCQDCGVRLVSAPSVATAAPAAAPAGEAAAPAKKPRILSAKRHNPAVGFLAITARTILLAAIAAVVILTFRSPANLPAEDTPLAPEVVENIRAGLQRSAQIGQPVNVPWSGQGLNAFVGGVLASAKPGTVALLAPVAEGFTLFVRHKLGPLALTTTSTFHIVSRGNGLGVARTGGAIGCLPLPGPTASLLQWTDESVAAAMAPELETLRNATAVQTTPQQVRVIFGGAAR